MELQIEAETDKNVKIVLDDLSRGMFITKVQGTTITASPSPVYWDEETFKDWLAHWPKLIRLDTKSDLKIKMVKYL